MGTTANACDSILFCMDGWVIRASLSLSVLFAISFHTTWVVQTAFAMPVFTADGNDLLCV